MGGTVDFPDYPDGYDATNVVSVYPHEDREQWKSGIRKSPDYEWCYYVIQ